VRKLTYLSFALLLTFSVCEAQQLSTKSQKAADYFHKATLCYEKKQYSGIIRELHKAIKEDSSFVEAHLLMAEAYQDANDVDNAIKYYISTTNINPDFFPLAFLNLANLEFSSGKYESAKVHYIRLCGFTLVKNSYKETALKKIKNCDFAMVAIKHPVPFDPQNLGENINTKYDEYWPSVSADEQTLVFTTRLPKKNPTPADSTQEDFFISHKANWKWEKAENMGTPINTPNNNEGAQSLSTDGKIMFFTGCDRSDGLGKCDIYFSRRVGDKWNQPINLGKPINTKYSEKQPSISPDGKTLYFSSNRPGGKGSMDIWASTLTDSGYWGNPVNLGDSINTRGNETSPYIHFDNQTLYFSSDSLPGMGSFDIFLSRRNKNGKWGIPQNLGYPINTSKKEEGFIVNAAGNWAYFASNRLPGNGLDIYTFELPAIDRPNPVSYMKGKVYDSDTKMPLEAKFQLINLANEEVAMESYSNPDSGEFMVCIPSGRDYALNVSRKGYMFYSDNFSLKERHDFLKPFIKDVPLQPIKIGDKMILKNIFFETGSYTLKKESVAELNKLAQFMKDNPDLKIEISGHTDNVGSDEYNLKLSQNRAKSVTDYLTNKSIDLSRIDYKGYGKTQPLTTNDTEEGRAQNRRTEFKVIK
jgi:outer membrane protein OmpA-like peptidoglycan-associated protein/tetratricopeptide (TPR) repeat protein